MPISPADILSCAQQLSRNTKGVEAIARAAVGRAYYAAYHDCLDWHVKLPAQGEAKGLPANAGIHAELAARLSNPAGALSDAQKTLSRERGLALRKLHGDRVSADYKLKVTVQALEARNALSAARKILALT